MPGRDGTGPIGMGRMSGRGLGPCSAGAPGYGAGRGLGLGRRGGRGYGRGFGGCSSSDRDNPMTRKETLSEQKQLLEDRLDFINRQLGEL